ncbi:MAG TPA: hypothetical protein VGN09_26205 [Vicinamibacteria bacterium]
MDERKETEVADELFRELSVEEVEDRLAFSQAARCDNNDVTVDV